MADAEEDRLVSINNEIRDLEEDQSSCWLPLESNPDILNTFGKRVGLPDDWEFVDVLGFDPMLLAMVPKPVACCVFLFPVSATIVKFRRQQERNLMGKQSVPKSAFFLEQVAEFGNACGTIASVHALTNSHHIFTDGLQGDLRKFMQENENKSPSEIGKALHQTKSLQEGSDVAASSAAAQTDLPSRDADPLDHHFAAFCQIDGRCFEFDGTKFAPIDHGNTGDDFLTKVAEVIQNDFLNIEPNRLDFNLMACVKK